MKLILLSGGSGKRLWPLSNDSRSKQFLNVLDNNGELESMVQRVWRQLKENNLSESTIIATSKSQVHIIQGQLGDQIPLVIEPERRDTFPAIALAAAYLYSIKKCDLKEVVVVLPVDPYVDISFFEKMKDLEGVLINSNAELALMGVKPTYPSEKYGYIVPVHRTDNTYFEVSYFREKPSEQEAKELINQNAFWNCGVFSFKLEYIISLLHTKGLPTDYEKLLESYQLLEKISFDYEVVEKAEKIVGLAYNGEWKDLGTWNTLTEEMSTNQIGIGNISEDSSSVHLVNELDIPVIVLGIKDAVVVASPDGILVTDKIASPKIKDLLKGYEQRPMYEERRWGWYKVLDYIKVNEDSEVLTKKIGIKAGQNLSYQMHHFRSETWTIIKGEGEFVLNDKLSKIKAGDVIFIPIGARHGVKAICDLELIEIQNGSQLIEEDIVRIFNTWDEVELYFS